MTVRIEDRKIVKRRANYVCEYCGVSEIDVGGELTLDHYRPTALHNNPHFQRAFCATEISEQKVGAIPTSNID
jgi:hypothetical protein